MTNAELMKQNADLLAQNEKLTKTATSQSRLIKTLRDDISEHTKLAAEAGDALKEVAKDAGNAVETGVNSADTPGALSSDTQDALIEAVSKVDPDVGAELTQELTDLEMTDEDMSAEKVAGLTTKVFEKLAAKMGGKFREGRVRTRNNNTRSDKNASAGNGSFLGKLGGELDSIRNNN